MPQEKAFAAAAPIITPEKIAQTATLTPSAKQQQPAARHVSHRAKAAAGNITLKENAPFAQEQTRTTSKRIAQNTFSAKKMQVASVTTTTLPTQPDVDAAWERGLANVTAATPIGEEKNAQNKHFNIRQSRIMPVPALSATTLSAANAAAATLDLRPQINGKRTRLSVGVSYQFYSLMDISAPQRKDVYGFVNKKAPTPAEEIKEYTYPSSGSILRGYALYRPTKHFGIEVGLGYVQSKSIEIPLSQPVQWQEYSNSLGAGNIQIPKDTLYYGLHYSGIQTDMWLHLYQAFGRHTIGVGAGGAVQCYNTEKYPTFQPFMLMAGTRMRYSYALTQRLHAVTTWQLTRALTDPLQLDDIQPFRPIFTSGSVGLEFSIGK